jgi:hypothetical protein
MRGRAANARRKTRADVLPVEDMLDFAIEDLEDAKDERSSLRLTYSILADSPNPSPLPLLQTFETMLALADRRVLEARRTLDEMERKTA